jgi:phage gpG-like protein
VIEIKMEGTQEASRLFAELARRTSDTEPAMRQIAEVMRNAVEENFEQQGRPKWTPLSKARIKERTRKGTWPSKI